MNLWLLLSIICGWFEYPVVTFLDLGYTYVHLVFFKHILIPILLLQKSLFKERAGAADAVPQEKPSFFWKERNLKVISILFWQEISCWIYYHW